MKKQLGITITLALCLLASGAVQADDAILGALLGGGAGAVVGRSVGGRDGTIIGGALGAAAGAAIGSQQRGHGRVEYVAPPVYYAAPAYQQQVYYPQQQVYYSQPVRTVYYVQRGYDHDKRGRYEHRDRGWDRGWDRDGHDGRGRDDRH